VDVNGDSASPLFDWLKLQPGFDGEIQCVSSCHPLDCAAHRPSPQMEL